LCCQRPTTHRYATVFLTSAIFFACGSLLAGWVNVPVEGAVVGGGRQKSATPPKRLRAGR
jgi:hypothetical protein